MWEKLQNIFKRQTSQNQAPTQAIRLRPKAVSTPFRAIEGLPEEAQITSIETGDQTTQQTGAAAGSATTNAVMQPPESKTAEPSPSRSRSKSDSRLSLGELMNQMQQQTIEAGHQPTADRQGSPGEIEDAEQQERTSVSVSLLDLPPADNRSRTSQRNTLMGLHQDSDDPASGFETTQTGQSSRRGSLTFPLNILGSLEKESRALTPYPENNEEHSQEEDTQGSLPRLG